MSPCNIAKIPTLKTAHNFPGKFISCYGNAADSENPPLNQKENFKVGKNVS